MKRYFSIVSIERAKFLIRNSKCVVVDVRDPHEHLKSHLKQSISIPLSTLKSKSIKDVNPDNKEWVLVHCQLSLIRGPSGAQHLDGLVKGTGFKVGLIEGGFKGFQGSEGSEEFVESNDKDYSRRGRTITEFSKDLQTSSSPMRIRIFKPKVEGIKFPGVCCFTEIYQITGPVERFCRRIASYGFVVVVNESYHEFLELGRVLEYNVEGTDLGNKLKRDKTVASYDEDATLMVDYLMTNENCNGKIGAVGMCLGGHLAYRCAFDSRVLASVCYFPTDIHSNTLGGGSNSLLRTPEIRGEVLLIFGKYDPHVPLEGRRTIKKALEDGKVCFGWSEVEAEHAFIRDECSKERYDGQLADICFIRMIELFNRRLVIGIPVPVEEKPKELVC